MKNLLTLLSPFAPDQSGAVSVLYELGGLIVICDAGGCAGNVCGFDEPRWFEKKSAVFSAGLRDMDAIMGRDDKLIEKLADACSKTDVKFSAIVGTPVPAVIATDYKALKRMAQNKTNLPAIMLDTTGTNHYDIGQREAYFELFKTFAAEKTPIQKGKIGCIGCTPLDISMTKENAIKSKLGENVVCYGMGCTLEDVINASCAEKNLVISPSGIKAAEYLKGKFGTPYEVYYPLISDNIISQAEDYADKKILIIHQQMAANALRDEMQKKANCHITCATWFLQDTAFADENDFTLRDEEDFKSKVSQGNYDIIIGDEILKRTLIGYKGEYIDFVHFAVSGRLESN